MDGQVARELEGAHALARRSPEHGQVLGGAGPALEMDNKDVDASLGHCMAM